MEAHTKLPNWLGITKQQFGIIEAIISLQEKNHVATPKSIIEEDSIIQQSSKIQKSNFFSQLKSLQNRGYVKKIGEARYRVNLDSIKSALDQKEQTMETEQEELRKARDQTESYLIKQVDSDLKPPLEFVEYNEMYNRLATLIRRDDSFYIIGVFPRILYVTSPSLMYNGGAMRYAQTLWHHCFHAKDLEVTYLTNFDVNYFYNTLVSLYNRQHAYDEVSMVLRNTQNMLDETPNLHIYYSPVSYNVGTAMPYVREPREFFLMLRDAQNRGRGAVYANAPELAQRFKNVFEEDCSKAPDMRSSKGSKVIRELQKRLDKTHFSQKKKEIKS